MERVDEELHVLSLNDHASTATTQILHNGSHCELGSFHRGCGGSWKGRGKDLHSGPQYSSELFYIDVYCDNRSQNKIIGQVRPVLLNVRCINNALTHIDMNLCFCYMFFVCFCMIFICSRVKDDL